MLKAFLFTEEQMDSIYEFIYIAQDVAETREEKTKLQEILKTIDKQTNYVSHMVNEYAITAPGFEFPDTVYAETKEQAIIQWADTIVGVEVTQIMPGGGSYENR